MRFGLGFQLNRPPNHGPNPRAFGHAGYGGSLGFADPEPRLGFGYTPNQYLAGLGDDPPPLHGPPGALRTRSNEQRMPRPW